MMYHISAILKEKDNVTFWHLEKNLIEYFFCIFKFLRIINEKVIYLRNKLEGGHLHLFLLTYNYCEVVGGKKNNDDYQKTMIIK